MRDLQRIVEAFPAIAGRAALATVVAVEGSSYRRPGARMLVSATGQTFGGVSGGCLERDVARLARDVIDSGSCIHKRYETDTDDLGATFAAADAGASLGCGGSIEILIEPVSSQRPGPMPALQAVVSQRRRVALATVFGAGGAPGCLLGRHDWIIRENRTGDEARETQLPDQVSRALGASLLAVEATSGRGHRIVQPDGWMDVLIESLRPAPAIVLFGDGADVEPMAELMHALGWHITIISALPLPTLRRAAALVDVHQSLSNDSLELPADMTAAVVMNHNLKRDAAVLAALARQPAEYIGVLGPRRRTQRLLDLAGPSAAPALGGRLFAPVGLDIGAQTPEQVALSVAGEIQAVLAGRAGGLLRDRIGPIHESSSDHRENAQPTDLR